MKFDKLPEKIVVCLHKQKTFGKYCPTECQLLQKITRVKII